MGAVTFSIDSKLMDVIKKAFPEAIFVETGSFKGDSIALAKHYFSSIYSIELSKTLYEEVAARFASDEYVHVFQGDSAKQLKNIIQKLPGDASIVYWLDAHWCQADNTAGDHSQCPLLEEIHSIGTLNDKSILAIDDARLFLAPPPQPHEISQWPNFHDIVQALLALSKKHRLMVINDIILFYPEKIDTQIRAYAYEQGLDWNTILNDKRETLSLQQELCAKEAVIQELNAYLKYVKSLGIDCEKLPWHARVERKIKTLWMKKA